MHPFSFSVASSGTDSATSWSELARAAEDLGYRAVLMDDHVGQPMAPLPALAVAAAVTSTLRLGTRVLNADLRNPVLTAHEIVTLDLLSDGRAEWGAGAGWHPGDYTSTGVPLAPGAVRAERLVEAVTVIDRLLTDGHVSFSGTHHHVEADDMPKPVQRPRPPLTVGAGRRRLLEYAARTADVVSIVGASRPGGGMAEEDLLPERLDEKVGWIRAAAGERIPRLEHVVWECLVTPRPAAVREAYAHAMGCPPERLRALPALLIGSVEEVVDILHERRERWGLSSLAVPAAALHVFAPVVARLTGR